MNRRKTGTEWEKAASEYLQAQGMRIVERNFRCRQGEIDLVGYHQGYLVFVEVKYRRTDVKGSALEAVDGRKQRRICRAADYYRLRHGIGSDAAVRYDVVAVQDGRILWLRNAFPHVEPGRGGAAVW